MQINFATKLLTFNFKEIFKYCGFTLMVWTTGSEVKTRKQKNTYFWAAKYWKEVNCSFGPSGVLMEEDNLTKEVANTPEGHGFKEMHKKSFRPRCTECKLAFRIYKQMNTLVTLIPWSTSSLDEEVLTAFFRSIKMCFPTSNNYLEGW